METSITVGNHMSSKSRTATKALAKYSLENFLDYSYYIKVNSFWEKFLLRVLRSLKETINIFPNKYI